jgi:hypothetical protein
LCHIFIDSAAFIALAQVSCHKSLSISVHIHIYIVLFVLLSKYDEIHHFFVSMSLFLILVAKKVAEACVILLNFGFLLFEK